MSYEFWEIFGEGFDAVGFEVELQNIDRRRRMRPVEERKPKVPYVRMTLRIDGEHLGSLIMPILPDLVAWAINPDAVFPEAPIIVSWAEINWQKPHLATVFLETPTEILPRQGDLAKECVKDFYTLEVINFPTIDNCLIAFALTEI